MYLFHAFPCFSQVHKPVFLSLPDRAMLRDKKLSDPYRPKDRVGSPLEWPDVFVLSNSEWKSKNFGQNSHWVVTWWTSDPSVTSGALLQFRVLKTDLRVVPIVHTLYTRLWIVTCRKDQQRLVYSRILVIQKTGNVNIFVKKTACPFNLAILIPTVPTFSPTVPTVRTFSPTPRFDVVSCIVVSDIERPRLSRTGVHGQFLPQKKAAERLLMPRFDLNDSQRISITAVIVMKKS